MLGEIWVFFTIKEQSLRSLEYLKLNQMITYLDEVVDFVIQKIGEK